MLRCLPLFFVLASAVAAGPPVASPQNSAYEKLHVEALVTRLLDSAAEDLEAHRLEAALAKATQADALRPNDAVILNTRGAALVELKRFDEAKKVLAAAIAADPQAFAPQFNLGAMLLVEKKYPDAALQFTQLQTRFGPISRLKYNLYLSYALAGNKDRARETLDLMRYPTDGIAWYFAFAADGLIAGRKAEAGDLLAAARAIHSDEISTYLDTLKESGLLK